MAEAPQEGQNPEFDPNLELEGVTVDQLLALNGTTTELENGTAKLTIKKTDDTTIEITSDQITKKPLFINIDPETGNLYLQGKGIPQPKQVIQNIIYTIKLIDRNIDPSLPNFDKSTYRDNKLEAIKAHDKIMAWIQKQVARTITETGFGDHPDDTIRISFSDKDISERSLLEIDRLSDK